jgi:DNA-binding transcriptional MerR regulator
MEASYRVTDLERLFGVSSNTIRRWAAEFEAYLNPQANPGDEKTRVFMESDVEVLALVASMKAENRAPYEDIHAALKSGERGVIPEMPKALMATDDRDKLVRQIGRLELQIENLKQELEDLKEENIRLSEQVKMQRELGQLEGRLEALQNKGEE